MKPLFDLHTHTLASGHAYSTLKENIEAAAERGLAAMGFSDHAPAMPGTCHPFHFGNFKVIRPVIDGVRIYKGIEANITDYKGTLDLDDINASKLDYVIASLHPPCVTPGSVEENTRALVEVMKNPLVKIIGHPDDDRFPIDHKELVIAAGRERVALELNNSSLRPGTARLNARKNILEILDLCRIYDVPVLMGSDAHIYYDVGGFTEGEAILRETNFPVELALNYKMEGLDYVLNNVISADGISSSDIPPGRAVASDI